MLTLLLNQPAAATTGAVTSPYAGGLDLPALNADTLTPNDGADLTSDAHLLYVGVSGDIALTTSAGDNVTFKAAPVGFLPVRVKRLKATGTTATNILGLR